MVCAPIGIVLPVARQHLAQAGGVAGEAGYIMEVKRLDSAGRCCGRKPLPYKGSWRSERQRFCVTCDRSFDYDTGVQRQNFAWTFDDGVWTPRSFSAKADVA